MDAYGGGLEKFKGNVEDGCKMLDSLHPIGQMGETKTLLMAAFILHPVNANLLQEAS